MKSAHKIGLLMGIASIATAMVWLQAAPNETTARKTKWEYWATHGNAGVVLPGMEQRLNQGFEIDRLETTPPAPGQVDAYVVVVLKREK